MSVTENVFPSNAGPLDSRFNSLFTLILKNSLNTNSKLMFRYTWHVPPAHFLQPYLLSVLLFLRFHLGFVCMCVYSSYAKIYVIFMYAYKSSDNSFPNQIVIKFVWRYISGTLLSKKDPLLWFKSQVLLICFHVSVYLHHCQHFSVSALYQVLNSQAWHTWEHLKNLWKIEVKD